MSSSRLTPRLRTRQDGSTDHRRIADEYCGGAAVTKFPTKYFRIEFMRREFVVRVIGTLLVVLYILVNKLV